MGNTDIYFLEMVREFKKIEKEFIKFTYEVKKPNSDKESQDFLRKAIKLAFSAVEKRNKILGEMNDVSDIQLNDEEVKSTINKIRKGEQFESLAFAQSFADVLNEKIDNDFDKIKIGLQDYFEGNFDDLYMKFNSWFDISEYYYRKAQIGAIITSIKLPNNIINYFTEIKEAYAFGLDKSCISLSRALIEIALHDKLKRKGFFKKAGINKASNVIDFDKKDTLWYFIIEAKKQNLISPQLKKVANEIRERGNDVLHIKDTDNFSVRGLALKTIKDTIELIEFLYR